jgi:hypothetical protein
MIHTAGCVTPRRIVGHHGTSPSDDCSSRSIVHAIERGRVVDGTEIWVHVELTSAEQGDRLAKAVPLLLHRGLDLLASELDAR